MGQFLFIHPVSLGASWELMGGSRSRTTDEVGRGRPFPPGAQRELTPSPCLRRQDGNSFDALPEVGRHLLSAEASGGGGGSEVSLFFFHVEMTSAPQHEWAVDS